jgi:hypothetical protein
MLCPAILRQCRVLHEGPCGSWKYLNCLTDWCASDNKLQGTPLVSRKKPNAGRSPTCHLWTADANSPMPRCAMALRSYFQNGMVMAWHRCSMACVTQTWLQCVNQMGNTQSKPLVTLHGVCKLAFSVLVQVSIFCITLCCIGRGFVMVQLILQGVLCKGFRNEI